MTTVVSFRASDEDAARWDAAADARGIKRAVWFAAAADAFAGQGATKFDSLSTTQHQRSLLDALDPEVRDMVRDAVVKEQVHLLPYLERALRREVSRSAVKLVKDGPNGAA